MVKSYCVTDKMETECIEPSGYYVLKNGRYMHFCTCAVCKNIKTKFVKKTDEIAKIATKYEKRRRKNRETD